MEDLFMDPLGLFPSSYSSPHLETEIYVEQVESSQPSYFPQLGAAGSGEWTGSFEVDPASLSVRDGSTEENSSSNPDRQVNIVTFPSSQELVPTMQSDSLLAFPNFEGAMALFNATGAAMLGMGQTLMTGPPAVLQGLVSRVQTTLRGSADDIGWLRKDPSLPPVVDKTKRFVQLLGRISSRQESSKLDDIIFKALEDFSEVGLMLGRWSYDDLSGLFSNHGPLYFVDTKKYFSKLGLSCHIARIHSEAGVETNAREIKEYIEELYWGTGKRVILLGHSKGGVDAAAACAIYWPELKDKVVGLVFAQSPYGGSPIAADILRKGQLADSETRRVLETVITKVIKGEIQALEDLTYEKRREFVANHRLPTELPTVSFHTEASRSPSALSTMSHIAHADVIAGKKLPLAIPLSAAMALTALHIDLRYGEKSDGLVARKDAEVPGSVVVRLDKKLDHAWMVYSPSRKKANDPDAAQMCEALLTLLLEEEARKTASCNGDRSAREEDSKLSSPGREMPSTEIQEGEDYLEGLEVGD